MNKNTMILVAVVVLVLLGGLWYMQTSQPASTTDDTAMEGTTEEEAIVDDTTGEDAMDSARIVELAAVEGSDTTQTGTATLTEADGAVTVVVEVSPALDNAQPAHIHDGECPGVGAIAYPLKDLVDGMSTTVIQTTMAELDAKTLAINIHKSAAESKVYTSCGSL